MNGTKKEVDMLVRIGVLEKLVDNLLHRVDEANVKSVQAESLVKQVIDVVQKTEHQLQNKDEWDDVPEKPEIPDELTMFTGVGSGSDSLDKTTGVKN